jgi:Na+-driven multidrug efflux pump
MHKIENIKQVNALISETYMYAIIIAIIALAIAFFIVQLIHWQGGRNDRSHIKRRLWYIIIGLIAPISFFLYNTLVVSGKITKAPLVAKFSTANLMATLSILGIYAIIGIITMMIFRKSKWGSILGNSKL